MYERSPRQTASPEEMQKAIRRALTVMKGSDMPLTFATVAKRAASYSNASASFLETYVKRLTESERTELGFPPVAVAAPVKKKPSMSGVGGGWKPLQFRRHG